jgi:Rho-binding antiterminator
MKFNMKNYMPINCNYYDVLEGYATLRQKVKIDYVNDEGEPIVEETLFKDFQTKNKEEFALLASGTVVRLDRITHVTPVRE